MQFVCMGLATLFVIVLVCTGVLLFGSRPGEGGGLQNPPHNIPMPSKARKQEKQCKMGCREYG